jgi:hypothetical protein
VSPDEECDISLLGQDRARRPDCPTRRQLIPFGPPSRDKCGPACSIGRRDRHPSPSLPKAVELND